MLLSVVITTYDRPGALTAVLNGLRRQSDRDFEVIIADDGSDTRTSDAVHPFHGRLKVAIRRVWQPHRGFRAAAIRNRAIAAAEGDYVILLDGDCVPRPDFLARHRMLAEPGCFVAGGAVRLSRGFTARLMAQRVDASALSRLSLLSARFKGNLDRFWPLLRLPLGPLRKAPWLKWQRIGGGNVAAWREDLLRIDGYDGAYAGWGLEDADLALRLANAGLRLKDGRGAATAIHLWHAPPDKAGMTANLRRLERARQNRAVRARAGISTLTRLPAHTGRDKTGASGDGYEDDKQ